MCRRVADVHMRELTSPASSSEREDASLLPTDDGARASLWLNVCVAAGYGTASVITTLANKALLSSWEFDFVFALLLMQNVLTVVATCALKRPSSSSMGTRFSQELDFPLWRQSLAVAMVPVMTVCLLNLVCGMYALQLSSVPVYQTLMRMTPLPTMLLDCVLRGKRFSAPVCLSVLVVCCLLYTSPSPRDS